MTKVLATVSASLPRRVFGIGVLLLLGGVVLYIGLARPHDAPGWQAFMLVFGVLMLWLAEMMRRATGRGLRLTEEALVDNAGRELARVDQIEAVERGTFAMKPTNGFVLHLKTAPGRAWAPGMWWRLGRRVGIGGVPAAGQTKFMAEILTARLHERAQADDA